MPGKRTIPRVCRHCQNSFLAPIAEVNRGRGVFCSKPCEFARRKQIAETSIQDRFWGYVQKSDDPAACWLWTGTCYPDGYGLFWIGSKSDGSRRTIRASRVALGWQLGRDVPPNMSALHRCDTPLCVRNDGELSHLFEGTQLDNVVDMYTKRRSANGQRLRFLDDSQIREIRERRGLGETCASLAREFGVARSTISRIGRGVSWTHP